MTAYPFDPIGNVRSCFTEKFGAPRQPGLVPQARAIIDIAAPYNQIEAFRGLEQFSHLWILFIFHQCPRKPWKPTVRPPRLGGNQRLGVFATRSGFRPNPIGQSAVALEKIIRQNGSVQVHVRGHDFVDGTPVIDIKPYLPYADAIPSAHGAYAHAKPAAKFVVRFSEQAAAACRALENGGYPQLRELATSVLALDPRPAYCRTDLERRHGLTLWDLNIRYRIEAGTIVVETISSGMR